MTTLAWIILAFIVGVAASSGVVIYAGTKKKGDPTIDAWIKIRAIIDETLVQVVALYQADQIGYDALVEFAVTYLKNNVDSADFLSQAEKDLLTVDFIRGILEPQIKKLWNKKML